MKRRIFFKKIQAALGMLLWGTGGLTFCTPSFQKGRKIKNWLWYAPSKVFSSEDQKRLVEKIKKAGIDAILVQVYNSAQALYKSKHLPSSSDWLEQFLPLAKSEQLEVHAWMWCMPCNIQEIQFSHPVWFAVNGKGEPSYKKPAYVNYYKFMCPNQEGVQEFVKKNVEELAQGYDLDGIHFDYIRFPDVILPEKLQKQYNIIQDREYPEYDYCYCEICRNKFKNQSGFDPMALENPSQHEQWRQFRYDSITHLVNDILIPAVTKDNKLVTAAVFPNWQHVRQEWSKWKLDAALPMLYHTFYDQGIDWIKEMTRLAVRSRTHNTLIFSGLTVSAFSPTELIEAVEAVLSAGASGVSLFEARALTEEHWKVLSDFMQP